MRELLDLIEKRQSEMPHRIVDVQRHIWAESICNSDFMAQAFRCLHEAMVSTANEPDAQTRVRRERIILDSTFLWLEKHVQTSDTANRNRYPERAEVLQRHREDWRAYIASVFDIDGQKLAMPIIETGLSLAEKLRPEDTEFAHRPVAVQPDEVTLDGKLSEPFWQQAISSRLLPRDATQPNDDPTSIRLAWSSEALYVGVEQPADRASAILGISLMSADRKGIQLSLYATKTNGPQSLGAYFYDYDPNGSLRIVKDRKASSQSVGSITDTLVTTEMRFLWSDLDARIGPLGDGSAKPEFLFHIEAYPSLDSKVPSHVSSPWLIGTSPTWHSGYFKPLRLPDPEKSPPR
jgi:hypothetical protein